MGMALGFPIVSDASVLYTPTLAGGGWQTANPLTNLQSRYLAAVARSISASLQDARFTVDLQTARSVGILAFPKHTLSSAGKVRFLCRPDSSGLLFDYEAGVDIGSLGGTFSRASGPATYVDSSGVLQYAGENLELYSEDFTNGVWTLTNVTVAAGAASSPDGATGMTSVTETAANGAHSVAQAVTQAQNGLSVTVSRYVKQGLRRYVQLDLGAVRFAAGANAVFDLQTGTVLSTGAGLVSAAITTDPRLAGVYRISVTATATSTGAYTATLSGSTDGTTLSYAGTTTSAAFYVWGAQSQAGRKLTRYLKTTSAAVAQLRDGHFISGARTTLLEGQRTNQFTWSEDFSNAVWSKTRTSVSTDADLAPDGTLSADRLVEDTSVSTTHLIGRNISITANANAAIAVFVKAGTRSRFRIQGRDSTTAGLFRQSFDASNGTLTSSSVSGSGALAGSGITALKNGWYLCWVAGSIGGGFTSLVTELVMEDGTGAAAYTGDGSSYLVLWGMQEEDNAAYPTSYIPTHSAAVTRYADNLSFALPAGLTSPVAATAYMKFVERGTLQTSGARSLWIGTAAISTNALWFGENGGGRYIATVRDAGGTAWSSGNVAPPAFGDTVEIRVPFTNGTVGIGESVNGAAETVPAASAAFTALTQWGTASPAIYLNSAGGASYGATALRSLRIMAGGAQSLATMQASVYDSGWLAAWPNGLTAEDLDGTNIPVVHIPSAAQTCRYVSVQIDDANNSAGYVDLARLVVAQAIRPTVNMAYSAKLGVDTQTERVVTDGGAAVYNHKSIRRVVEFALDDSYETEAMGAPWRLLRRAQLDAQLFFVYDTADAYMYERAFLGVLKALSPVEFPYYNAANLPFAVIEEL